MSTAIASLRQRLLAEFLGTALLLATVVGSGIMCVALSRGNDGVALLANAGATAAILYVLIVVLGLALHQFGTYSLFLKFVGGKSPWQFFSETREAMLTAFSTSSSNATLPVSMRVAEEKLRLPPQISRFVLYNDTVTTPYGAAAAAKPAPNPAESKPAPSPTPLPKLVEEIWSAVTSLSMLSG